MTEKRGQSAMEFLMTYGWAIIVVIVILSALYFLGVFSPKTVNTCSIQAPFICNDFAVKENGVIFSIGSSKISSGTVDSITVNGQNCNILHNTLTNNGITQIECSGINLSSGKINADIQITYTLVNSDLNHTILGKGISSNIEEGFIGELPTGGLVFGWDGSSLYNYVNTSMVGAAGGGLLVGNNASVGHKIDSNSTYFNGTTWISYGDIESLSFPNNIFSIGFWMKAIDTNSKQGILGKHPGANWEYSIYANTGGTLTFGAFTSDGSGVYSNSVSYDTNWTYFVWTADGSASRVYKNGVGVSTVSKTAGVSMSNTASSFQIGRGGTGAGEKYMNGTIDEVAVWSRALSAGEVQNLYNYYL